MTNRYRSLTVLGVALTLAAPVGMCTDAIVPATLRVRTPDTAAARAAAEPIARVQRAITGYFGACTAQDGRALNAVTTDDVRFEYTLQDAGSYLSVDATSLRAVCPQEAATSTSELWIFPTNDPDTVFVRYALGSAVEGVTQQLALVEMQGERIARMVNFSTPTSLLATSTACAPLANAASNGRAAFNNHCRTCHSLEEGDDRLGPSLYGIFGAELRSRSGNDRFALQSSSPKITWDEDTLDRFIADPDQVMPNDMEPYSGIADAAVRKSIVDFLKMNPGPWIE